MLTKGYSHLDKFQSSDNYCNCDGNDCDVVAEDDDDENDKDNVGGDDDDGDSPDIRFLFEKGGKATGMCLQFLIYSHV